MKSFDLPRLVGIHNRIATAREALKGKTGAIEEEEFPRWLKFLKEIESYCTDVHFHHAMSKAFGIHLQLETHYRDFTEATLAAHLEGLRDDIDICMFSHQFVQVVGDVKSYLDAKSLFGETVLVAFPNAIEDVQDAGNCIAVDLNTAAVFHLMHVVEFGLRALAIDVGLSGIITNKANGKTVPVEYAQWEQILNQMSEKIDDKIEAMPRGEAKQKAQEFYYSAASEIRGFKEAWRNHVMHTRRSYTREDALAVFSHVQRFMRGLAAYGVKAA